MLQTCFWASPNAEMCAPAACCKIAAGGRLEKKIARPVCRRRVASHLEIGNGGRCCCPLSLPPPALALGCPPRSTPASPCAAPLPAPPPARPRKRPSARPTSRRKHTRRDPHHAHRLDRHKARASPTRESSSRPRVSEGFGFHDTNVRSRLERHTPAPPRPHTRNRPRNAPTHAHSFTHSCSHIHVCGRRGCFRWRS